MAKERESKIFANTELDAIEKRKNGESGGGVFFGRAKPKIKELLEVWFPRRKELKELIRNRDEPKKKKK